uniref:Uncharacterized protein n=1 Tax=Entomoneis paludosa TaxID=265537 RepID=A0A7S2Y6B6_9STRA|mmetsp:Transcript_15667/g.32420  ORF Transcript_15667/g.32420 Transcript_15667/m.32420 type:complete len:311 (+) Transcript_15667:203-1135(+)
MNHRTRFVVGFMALLYVVSWTISLSNLFGIHFWNRPQALQKHYYNHADEPHNDTSEDDDDSLIPDGLIADKSTALSQVSASYYQWRRYIYFLPHVVGAIFWWNFYFFQLIPQVRHAYGHRLHRWLGRCLMVTALLQTVSGVGLAYTSSSHTIVVVSYSLAVTVAFCIKQAWMYARYKDIPRHKHWAMRLVGYMQTIALQRFWMVVLLIYHGVTAPENESDVLSIEQANEKGLAIFDDSFSLSFATAILLTEWYLAGEQGLLDPPAPSSAVPNAFNSVETKASTDDWSSKQGEQQRLLPTQPSTSSTSIES